MLAVLNIDYIIRNGSVTTIVIFGAVRRISAYFHALKYFQVYSKREKRREVADNFFLSNYMIFLFI